MLTIPQDLNYTKLIDNHFHTMGLFNLDDAQLDLYFTQLFAAGFGRALDSGAAMRTFAPRAALADKFAELYLASGFHPSDTYDDLKPDMSLLKEQMVHPKNVCVGEIGLDYSYFELEAAAQFADKGKAFQHNLFSEQLEIAHNAHLPVMLHVRDAHEDALALVKNAGVSQGVVHCFTGKVEIARKWLDAGFYLSFSGIVTFKKAPYVQASAAFCPPDRVLCETDAPWLAPVPHRGATNHPAYVAYVYNAMSELLDVPLSELVDRVDENFKTLYQLKS